MAIANPTPIIALERQVNGTNNNTWNDRYTANWLRVEDSIASSVSIDVTAADVTLTAVDSGDTNHDQQNRYAVIIATGTPVAARNIIWPAALTSKRYLLVNSSGQSVTFKVAAQTGVTLANGSRMAAWCNGTDIVVEGSGIPGSFTTLTASSTGSFGGALTVTAGGIAITGNSTITGTLGGLTGLTVASGGATVTGNSTITGTLGGLTGLTVASGGATITGNSTITGTLGGLTGLTVASGGAAITGNSTVTGTLTGNNVIVNSTTIPATGIYQPAATTLGLSANSALAFQVGPSGQFGIGGATYGTSGQVLTSGGAAAAPTWTTPTVPASILGAFRNLKVTSNAGLATSVITADEIAVADNSNNYVTLRSVSVTITSSTSGANGLDTGVLAATTWYSVWVIYNGTTTAGLMSASATAPTMPSGYTYKARVGWIRTSGTASANLGSLQYGRRAQWTVDGTTLTGMPQIAAGSVGSVSTPTYVATAWANFAPSSASQITYIVSGTNSTNGEAIIAPNANYGLGSSTSNPPPGRIWGMVNAGGAVQISLVPESANVYLATQANARVYVSGWEDNL